MPVSKEDVIWAYRTFLNRDPENDDVVVGHRGAANLRALCESFAASLEFAARRNLAKLDQGEQGLPPVLLPRLSIDTTASPDELRRLWLRGKQTWSELGEQQPFHSVLTEDRFQPDQMAEFGDDFWRSGEIEAREVSDYLSSLDGVELADAVLLEFGCGVGRVTIPLARFCKSVIAYDFSEPHLAVARQRMASQGCSNISLHGLSDLPTQFQRCDIFYSRIVLQHNPPPIIGYVVQKLIDALRPGGIGVFQVPTYCSGYRFDLAGALESPPSPDMEMHCFPQKQLFTLIERTGAKLVAVREDNGPGRRDLYVSNTVVLMRPA